MPANRERRQIERTARSKDRLQDSEPGAEILQVMQHAIAHDCVKHAVDLRVQLQKVLLDKSKSVDVRLIKQLFQLAPSKR